MKKYPEWYVKEKKNEFFFKSQEYADLMTEMITDYNNALKTGNIDQAEKSKNLVMKWINKKETNRLMIMQFEGTI